MKFELKIDTNGNEMLMGDYDLCGNFISSKGVIAVCKNNKLGFIKAIEE